MTDFPITNEEFEAHPWKTTEIGEYKVDYYILHTFTDSNLYIRITLKDPSFHSFSQSEAMAEVFKVKNYLCNEGFLDEEMEGTNFPDANIIIYSIFVYTKNNVIKENVWDKFYDWLKKKLYE